ncbi:hypothetical protein TRFO_24544 [Tritrichomonas foetus]|uniref:Protein kinase domain-containing protein n=1 Tax=Tritrichomonas foetus TaxID=1144522 RepID=A0A1J4KCX9_9EUKA|nr:hypothetical protein [Tritrichomonas foetus]OHT07293.1 hypothetical protein TRFO_24544 [Tritrichomonas foetus]|eukprot:OHT07293.1 hypothetical protein TRFO_24544 [Tritrichomonas foetus]
METTSGSITKDFSEFIVTSIDYKVVKELSKPGDHFGKVELVETRIRDGEGGQQYVRIYLSNNQLIFANQVDLFACTEIHPALIHFEGFHFMPNRAAIVEYYPNKSLGHILRDIRKGIPHPEWNGTMKSRTVIGILAALTHLHNTDPDNYSHNYVCPDNILFDSLNEPKLINYTLGFTDEPITHAAYCAPELYNDPKASHFDNDIWCFGMLLYEIYTESLPYEGLSDEDIQEEITSGHLPDFLPPSNETDYLVGIIQNCLEFEPSNRPHFHHLYKFLNNLTDSLFPGTDMAIYEDYKTKVNARYDKIESLPMFEADNDDDEEINRPDIDVDSITTKAASGDPSACNHLGRIYQKGLYGFPVDLDRAFENYKKSADKGFSIGLYNVALCYCRGIGCEKDDSKAAVYMKQAADKHYSQAITTYAQMLENGIGVPKDISKAVRLFEQGIDEGVVECMYNLALILYEGNKVPQDIPRALRYYELAAKNGLSAATNDSAIHYLISPKDRDLTKGISLFKRAARQNNPTAMLNLGMIYETGTFMVGSRVIDIGLKDEEEAYKFYKKASSLGNVKAMVKTANCLNKGIGVRMDQEASRKLYQKAADENDTLAMHNLARMIHQGHGGPVNLIQADKLYKKAADLGVAPSAYWHGKLLMEGLPGGPAKNLREAKKYMQIAANKKIMDSVELLRRL